MPERLPLSSDALGHQSSIGYKPLGVRFFENGDVEDADNTTPSTRADSRAVAHGVTRGDGRDVRIEAANLCLIAAKIQEPPPKLFLSKSRGDAAASIAEIEECVRNCTRFHSLKRWRRVAYFIYWSCSFFEMPTWCIGASKEGNNFAEDCGDSTVVLINPIGHVLTTAWAHVIHVCCLLVLLSLTLMGHRAFVSRQSFPTGIRAVATGSTSAALSIIVLVEGARLGCFCSPWVYRQTVFFLRMLRVVVLVSTGRKGEREAGYRLIIATRNALDSLGLLLMIVLTFSWMGILLFAYSREGDDYFGSPARCLLSLFTLITTANFPAVMMDAYTKTRWVFIFFFVYILLSLYVMQNLILANVSCGYRDALKDNIRRQVKDARNAHRAAFTLLATDPMIGNTPPSRTAAASQHAGFESNGHSDIRLLTISHLTWMALIRRHYKIVGSSFKQLAQEAFLEHEFKNSSYAGLAAPEFKEAWLFVERYAPDMNTVEAHPAEDIRAGLWKVDVAVDVVNTVVLVAMFAQTVLFLSAGSEEVADNFLIHGHCYHERSCLWFTFAWLFRIISLGFAFELAFKLWAYGIAGFWKVAPIRNRSDLCLIPAICIAELVALDMVSSGVSYRAVGARIAAVLRIARACLRLVTRVMRWRILLATFVQLLGLFEGLLRLTCLWYLLYATVGVHMFGGLIRRDADELANSDFALAAGVGYFENNFNDVPSAIVVLFEIMFVNDWPVIIGGLAAVVPKAPYLAYFYAISFWMSTFLITLNVVTSMFIEALSSSSEKHFDESRYALYGDEYRPSVQTCYSRATVKFSSPAEGSALFNQHAEGIDLFNQRAALTRELSASQSLIPETRDERLTIEKLRRVSSTKFVSKKRSRLKTLGSTLRLDFMQRVLGSDAQVSSDSSDHSSSEDSNCIVAIGPPIAQSKFATQASSPDVRNSNRWNPVKRSRSF